MRNLTLYCERPYTKTPGVPDMANFRDTAANVYFTLSDAQRPAS